MGLRGFLFRRGIYSVVLIFFVITLNFAIFELMPGQGTVLELLASGSRYRNDTLRQEIIKLWGLDQPVTTRFYNYVVNMLTWQFGQSYQSHPPGWTISDEIVRSGRLANTLALIGTATVVSLIIGLLLGVVAARRRGGFTDNASVISSLVTYSLPTFWMGIMFIVIFYSILNWFPLAGTQPSEWDLFGPPATYSLDWFAGKLRHLFLPALTLTLFYYGGYLLLTRATMLEVLNEDYITTARAKGVSERSILFKHALRNASLPLITSAALSFGFLLGGAIITEQVFGWYGLGQYIWTGIQAKDFPVLQAMFYVISVSVIVANFISDILYGLVDPRIKYE